MQTQMKHKYDHLPNKMLALFFRKNALTKKKIFRNPFADILQWNEATTT